jgi:hypothetical protein
MHRRTLFLASGVATLALPCAAQSRSATGEVKIQVKVVRGYRTDISNHITGSEHTSVPLRRIETSRNVTILF